MAGKLKLDQLRGCNLVEGDFFLVLHLMIAGRLRWRDKGTKVMPEDGVLRGEKQRLGFLRQIGLRVGGEQLPFRDGSEKALGARPVEHGEALGVGGRQDLERLRQRLVRVDARRCGIDDVGGDHRIEVLELAHESLDVVQGDRAQVLALPARDVEVGLPLGRQE